MTDTIHKQILEFKPGNVPIILEFPYGSEIISCQMQNDSICFWYRFNKENDYNFPDSRKFLIYGTGWDIEIPNFHKLKHISTVQSGVLVWHIFELIKSE